MRYEVFTPRTLAVAALLIFQACSTATSPLASPTSGGPATPKPDLGSANIRTSFPADGRFCYLYLAVKQRYFAAQGLEVKIDEGQNSTQVIQTVASGQDFMSVPSVNLLPIVRAQGAAVKAVAVLEQQHPAGVVVHGSGTITSPEQLAGKTINVGPGDAFTLLAPFLRANKVDPASVTINNTDHATKLQTFLAGRADAATIFSEGELPAILKADPKARFFPYSKVFQMYGLGLVVSEKTMADRPQAVAAAVQGVIAAEKYALEHPAECIDALVAAFPDRKFDRDIATGQMNEQLKLVVAAGRDQIGKMSDERWKGLEDILVQYFGIKPSGKPMTEYYNSMFLPK